MRLSKDQYFITMAVAASKRGTCVRRKVGCVLVDHLGNVVGTGYNGVARGLPHCIEEEHRCSGASAESGQSLDACEAIHAEQNALLQCADVSRIRTCYTTTKPCVHCMKLLMNTGCKRIVYLEDYPSEATTLLAQKAGIELIHLV